MTTAVTLPVVNAPSASRRRADRSPVGTGPSLLAGLDDTIVEEVHRAGARVHGPLSIPEDEVTRLKDHLKDLDKAIREASIPELAIGDPRRVRSTRLAIIDYLAKQRHSLPATSYVVDRLYQLTDGLGPLDVLFADQQVTGMHVYDWDLVTYDTWTGKTNQSGRPFLSPNHYMTVHRNLQDLGDVSVTTTDPTRTWTIPGGHRITADSKWLTVGGRWTLSIRKHRSDPLTLKQLVDMSSIPPAAALFLRRAMVRGVSVVFAGPPGAGKTTLMQAYVNKLCLNRRVVIIEREAEMTPPARGLVNHLEAQKRNASGETVFDMRKLVSHAVWEDPQLIVLGEVTDSAAADVIEAMTIGRAALTTTHGHDADDVLQRWENWVREGTKTNDPSSIKAKLAHSIGFIVSVWEGRALTRKTARAIPRSVVVSIDEVRGMKADGTFDVVPVFTLDEQNELTLNPNYELPAAMQRRGLWPPQRLVRMFGHEQRLRIDRQAA